MYDLTLYRLMVFTTIVEHHGVGAAAKELGLSQPSVSRHVHGLESTVGQPLFHRYPGRTIQLTDAGQVLYQYAHRAVTGAQNVAEILRDLQMGRRGHATMAVTRGLVHGAIQPILIEHYQRMPSILLTVHSGTMEEVASLVEKGEVAFGVLTTAQMVSHQLHSRLLKSVSLLVIASPRHHLARSKSINPHDLENEPCIIPYRSSSYYKLVFNLARKAGYTFYNIALEIDDGQAMSQLVSQGSAIAIAMQTAVEWDLKNARLVSLKIDPPLPSIELRMITRPNRRFSSAEESIMQLITERLGDQRTNAE